MLWCRNWNGRVVATAVAAGGLLLATGGSALAGPHSGGKSTWSIATMVAPKGAADTYITGVSCSAAAACTAFGDEPVPGGHYLTVAERWDGHWALQKTPGRAGEFGDQDLVTGGSCPASNGCVLVGHYTNQAGQVAALVERWEDGTWKVADAPAPNGAEATLLNGVACSSTDDCSTVGEYILSSSGNAIALAARSRDSGWQLQEVPSPSGSTVVDLHGVSCPAARACTAVGVYLHAGGYYSVAYQWNGRSWVHEKTPNPPHSNDVTLWSVSCPAAKDCLAVGSGQVTARTVPFAERWNGKSWAMVKVLAPSGSKGGALVSVDCISARDCVAAGENFSRSGIAVPLIEQWNGRGWTAASAPDPAHATGAEIEGVSCVSPTACVTAGSYNAGEADYRPFSEIER
jgi:hypothetical protein